MAGFEQLISEVREEYQIPPFISDTVLRQYAIESDAYFRQLKPNCNFDADAVYRLLLKARIYYAHNHVLNEFEDNYKRSILTWQMESEAD